MQCACVEIHKLFNASNTLIILRVCIVVMIETLGWWLDHHENCPLAFFACSVHRPDLLAFVLELVRVGDPHCSPLRNLSHPFLLLKVMTPLPFETCWLLWWFALLLVISLALKFDVKMYWLEDLVEDLGWVIDGLIFVGIPWLWEPFDADFEGGILLEMAFTKLYIDTFFATSQVCVAALLSIFLT